MRNERREDVYVNTATRSERKFITWELFIEISYEVCY